ncbi:MAG: sugar-binding domain-containing protein, partial [Spirochaetota bacterium]
ISQSHQQNELVRLLAQRMNAHAVFIYAPCYPVTNRDRELYMQTDAMRRLQEYWSALTVAVLGIGSPSRLAQTVPQSYLYTGNDSPSDERPSAVGDICVRLVDIDGKVCSSSNSDKVVGVPLSQLKKVPSVIAAAGGEEKAASILGALRTGVIDILVSDTLTMRRVLELNEETKSFR